MSGISSAVGDRIKMHRNRLGITQEELAERSGLHHTYVGQLERGEKNATLESVEKIVLGLGISYESLFEKLAPGNADAPTIAAQCYDLVDSLPVKEQQAVLDMILRMIEFKRI